MDQIQAKRMIFHLPFKPNPERPSASQIRPNRMIESFQNLGYEVDLVIGEARERKAQINDIMQKVKSGLKYCFLYSESSTMPTLLTERHHLPTYPFLDFGFFWFCKRHGIPLGLFYRDIHWRFTHYEGRSFVKNLVAKFFYKLDLVCYKRLLNSLFLPSIEMQEYIPETKSIVTYALPPGTQGGDIVNSGERSSGLKILYVGGLGQLYDLQLFSAFIADQRLSANEHVELTICCRPDDYERVKEAYTFIASSPNISFVNKQGEELVELYSNHDICCLFINPSEYWKFAMPVKLFEYISYAKPIICVEGTAVGNFVSKNRLGWSLPYSSESLLNWLKQINFAEIEVISQNIASIRSQHTWEARANQVEKIMLMK